MAVMMDQMPIGEVILKDINAEAKQCTLSIHMQNDSFKNRGYGTQAEMLTLEYAFTALNMKTVFADAIHKNKRSQHVLEKLDFGKSAAMIDSCILDATKKPGTDVTGQIVLFDHSKPRFIDIIAQSHPERNKIFILLRSQEPMKNQGCVPCEPLRCPLRPRQLRRRAFVNVLARNKILVLCRWDAVHFHMNNRFLSNGGILLSFF